VAPDKGQNIDQTGFRASDTRTTALASVFIDLTKK
jgi:hypothetical protein